MKRREPNVNMNHRQTTSIPNLPRFEENYVLKCFKRFSLSRKEIWWWLRVCRFVRLKVDYCQWKSEKIFKIVFSRRVNHVWMWVFEHEFAITASGFSSNFPRERDLKTPKKDPNSIFSSVEYETGQTFQLFQWAVFWIPVFQTGIIPTLGIPLAHLWLWYNFEQDTGNVCN